MTPSRLVTFALAASLGLIVTACSSSTPGRGTAGGGSGGGSGGGGTALCSSLSGNECVCSSLSAATSAGTGGTCSSANVSNAVCCGDLQWPGPGLTCTCESYACRQTQTDGSCECGNSTTGPTSTCGPVAGFTCCQRAHSYCECG